MRSRRRWRSGRALACAAVLGWALAPPTLAGAQAASELLEVRRIDAATGATVVAVPFSVSGSTLPATAFSAPAPAGGGLTSVARFKESLDVSLVVDVGDPLRRDALRAALVELVLSMPQDARVQAADDEATEPLGVDRQPALDALSHLADAVPRADRLAEVLATSTEAGRHHLVVAVTDRPDEVARPDASTVVDLVALGSTTGAMGDVATASGGVALTAADPDGVLAATDSIADDLGRLYALQVDPVSLAGTGAKLTVSGPPGAPGPWSAALVVVPAAGGPTPPKTAPSHPSSRGSASSGSASPETTATVARPTGGRLVPASSGSSNVGLVVLLAALAAAAVVVAVVAERHRRSFVTVIPPSPAVDLRSSRIAFGTRESYVLAHDEDVLAAERRALDGIARLASQRRSAPVRIGQEVYEGLEAASHRRIVELVAPGEAVPAVVDAVSTTPMVLGQDAAPNHGRVTVGLVELVTRVATGGGPAGPRADSAALAEWASSSGLVDVVIPFRCGTQLGGDGGEERHVTVVELLDAITLTTQRMVNAELWIEEWRRRYRMALDCPDASRASWFVDLVVSHPVLSLDMVHRMTAATRHVARDDLRWLADRDLIVEVARPSQPHKVWLAPHVMASVVAQLWAPNPIDIRGNTSRDERSAEETHDART